VLALKMDGVKGEWRKLRNEHRHYLYSLPDFIRVIQSRTIRLAGDVARRVRREMHTGFFNGKPEIVWKTRRTGMEQ
jgi:hypothetical protein